MIRDGHMQWSTTSTSSGLTPETLIPVQERWAPQNGWSPAIPLTILSVNLQSLQGKHRFVEEQLVCAGVQIACLQETKSSDGFLATHDFFRFGSDAERHWGVAVWVRKWIRSQDGTHFLQLSDFTQLLATSRCLVVHFRLPGCTVVAASVHLPQQQCDASVRREVLEQLAMVLEAQQHADLVVLGFDANARVPPDQAGVTGGLRHGDPDEAGFAFVDFLQTHRLFLPSTWHDVHVGSSGTWRHSRGPVSRIDFIAIGGAAGLHGCRSWVDYDFDLLHHHDDHWPVVLRGTVPASHAHAGELVLQKMRYDRAKIISRDGQRILADALRSFSSLDWKLHVDDHATDIQSFLHGVMDKHFVLDRKGPRARYIQHDVWQLRQRCHAFRKRTRFFQDSVCLHVLGEAFQKFRAPQGYTLRRVQHSLVLRELFASAVRFATGWAKKRIMLDRKRALHDWLSTLGHLQGPQLLGALRSFGVGGRKKKKARLPPPALRGEDGAFLKGQQELDDAWLRYFGDMEMGTVVQTADFLATARRGPGTSCEDVHFQLETLPTLLDIEQVFRQMVPGKATGLDLLPPEIYKACPQEMAKIYMPLFAKTCLKLEQPLAWSGGVLYELYKGSGAHDVMENHRSIFLASCPGKALQRLFRHKVSASIGHTLDGLHCGSKKGAPVTLPSLAVQLLCRHSKRVNRSFAAFLLDVKCAYYSVIREVAIGGMERDENIERLFHRFQLTGDDIAVLRDLIRQGGSMTASGLDSHLAAVVRSSYAHTWFVTRHGSQRRVCHTAAGSRPGANFADIVFAFIYDQILRKLRAQAIDDQVALRVPYTGTKELWVPEGSVAKSDVVCIDSSWADDTAAVAAADDPWCLLQSISRISSCLMDACRGFGLTPNLKRGKCALLLALRGPGSQRCKREYFGSDARQLTIVSSRGPDLVVHIEAQYNHLGTLLDRDGHLESETRRRLSIASSAFESSRRLLLQSRHVEFSDRIKLFQSLVTSTIFNLELWCSEGAAWASLDRGYAKLARRLLVGMCDQDYYNRMEGDEVFLRTGLLPLHILAAKKRIGFLAGLARAGNHAIWAVIQQEGTWAEQLRRDLRWLSRWSGGAWPEPQADHWARWWVLLADRPAWLKKCARRAALNWRTEENAVASARLFLRQGLSRGLGRSGMRPPMSAERAWCCPPCQRQFRSRAGLGVHFHKCHQRIAFYRHYASGTLCEACGMQFYSEKRLLLHMKTSRRCCDILAAAGRRRSEPCAGIRSWRRCRDEFVLCPPQKMATALEVVADGNRKWLDVPEMELAHQAALDKLVGFEGSTETELLLVLCGALRQFPLYEDEFRLVFKKLFESARFLLDVEEMLIWGNYGAERLAALLHRRGFDFNVGELMVDVPAIEHHLTWQDDQLFSANFWSHLMVSQQHRRDGVSLCISDVQGTSVDDTVVPSREALVRWFAEGWRQLSSVQLILPSKVEEEAFYQCREITSSSLGQAPSDHVLARLLLCCCEERFMGCGITVHAPPEFWSSPFSLPFQRHAQTN